MSNGDRKILKGLAMTKNNIIDELKEVVSITQDEINPYRKRLLDKGVVESKVRGYLTFTLPMFSDFINEYAEDYL